MLTISTRMPQKIRSPLPIEPISKKNDHIDSTLITHFFKSLKVIGIENARLLCDNNENAIAFLEVEESAYKDWHAPLNRDGLNKIASLITELENKIDRIFAAFQDDNFRYDEILIASFEVTWRHSCHIVARAGDLILKENYLIQGGETLLLSLSDFTNIPDKKLVPTHLCGLNLSNVDLRNANLEYSDLSNANLEGADLRGTKLMNAKLSNVAVNNRTKIDDTTQLQGAEFTITPNLKKWSHAELLKQLDYFSDIENTSLLTLINNIHDEQTNHQGQLQKIDLLHQILAALGNTDTHPIHEVFLDLFKNTPLFLADNAFSRFIKDKIVSLKIQPANLSELLACGTVELLLLLEIVEEQGDNKNCKDRSNYENLKNFMLINNGFFVQLIALCANHPNKAIRTKAENLYDAYLNFDFLINYNDIHLSGVNYINNGIREIDETEFAFVFINIEGITGKNRGLLTSQKSIREMLKPESGHDWSTTYYIENGRTISSPDLNHVYSIFRLFEPMYLREKNKNTFIKFLDKFNFNFSNTKNIPNLQNRDYAPLFKEAYKNATSTVKLVSYQDITALEEIFTSFYTMDNDLKATKLTDDHYQNICLFYKFSGNDHAIISQTLFVLGILAVKYSSAKIFGTEDDSPLPIRLYAIAFLNKAFEVSPDLYDLNKLTKWKKVLVGEEFPCTSVLAEELMCFAERRVGFKEVLAEIKSPAW